MQSSAIIMLAWFEIIWTFFKRSSYQDSFPSLLWNESNLLGVYLYTVWSYQCNLRVKMHVLAWRSFGRFHLIFAPFRTCSTPCRAVNKFWSSQQLLESRRHPPRKFWNLDALKCYFRHFPDSIWALKNNQNKTILTIFYVYNNHSC